LKRTGENLCQLFGNENNVYFADSLISLADLYKLKAHFDIANQIYKQALDIKIQVLGEHHLFVAEIYAAMSENMRISGNLEYADVYCQQALSITHETIGDDNIRFTLLNLLRGRILCDSANFSDSERYLRQCQQNIADKLDRENNLYYAYCIGILGECLRLQGKFTASAEMLSDSLNLFKKHFGNYHQMQGEIMLFNAMLLMDLNQVEEAEMLLVFKILGKIESILGSAHPLTIFVYGNIDLCKSKVTPSDEMSVSPMHSVMSIESTIPTITDIDTITAGSLTMSRKSFITRNSISYSVKESFNNIPVAKCISTLKKRKDLSYNDEHPIIIRLHGIFPKKNKEEAATEEAERIRLKEIEEELDRKKKERGY
jgi:tetratricopeptide (TPR) repeat protein